MNTRNKQTVRISFGSKDRAINLLRSLVRTRYFGDKTPSEAELSRLLRLPRTSVSLALQKLAAEGLIELEGDHAIYHGAKQTPTGQVAFVVNTDLLRGWYSLFQEWLIGFEHVMAEEGYEVCVASDFSSASAKLDRLDQLRGHAIMGAVFASRVEPSVLDFIRETRLPSVILGNSTILQEDVGCVCSDNRAGMEKLIDYLVEQNHRDIGLYATGLSFHDGFRERLSAYQAHMRHYDLTPRAQWIFNEPHNEFSARRAAEIFYAEPRKPTAIICASDREAFELVAELKHLEIEVPTAVSVVGFDNNHYGKILEPAMTTVDIFAEGMGRVAANYLLNEMQAPQLPVRILLPTELIVRQSVKKLPTDTPVSAAIPAKTPHDSGILTF